MVQVRRWCSKEADATATSRLPLTTWIGQDPSWRKFPEGAGVFLKSNFCIWHKATNNNVLFQMLLMEEILRVYRMVNPSCSAPQSISTTNIQKDTKTTPPSSPGVDPQELSQTLIENMNRALNCITNSKHSSAPMVGYDTTYIHISGAGFISDSTRGYGGMRGTHDKAVIPTSYLISTPYIPHTCWLNC